MNFQPGESFEYSNSGYFLLGYIIETVTGNTYEDELRTRIFEPLGMNDSGYDNHPDILENRASGYERQGMTYINAPYLDMGLPYAAGSLYSTVEDLYTWDQALYEDKLIKPDQPVILICARGVRTSKIAELLDKRLGYTQVHNVTAGINAWLKEERPVVKWER